MVMLQLPRNPLLFFLAAQPPSSFKSGHHNKPFKPFTARAESDPDPTPPEPSSDSDFEARLSRLRYRSGTGKKAEVRKTRKSAASPKGGSNSQSAVFLPPVPLKEPVSGGLKVDFGFSPYSERLNGRIACLGLAALLLVELATGQSVIKFHSPPIIFLQVYFVAAVTAVYVKFEKEKVSVWPEPTSDE
uniref:Uncharacterized protein n=1 Tax=Kalanchoe fedtschenkoi TaxID=63787 RepID=A0A7N0ZV33_KALFE